MVLYLHEKLYGWFHLDFLIGSIFTVVFTQHTDSIASSCSKPKA